ncbi:MAG TPA: alpha/beta hydrolase [Opitutaceae bacterium]|nr:alpha/beta hydrolase [Opitutaceae bacterium]
MKTPTNVFPGGWACGLTRCLLWLGFLLADGSVPLAAETAEQGPTRSVIYKRIGDIELSLDIFLPPGHRESDHRAAIVFFFGGGWNEGSPSQFYPHCRHLAAQGVVAFSANYRVKKRHGTTPRECVLDARSAIRWVRANAASLGVDTQRIAAGGGSAGGHIAAAAAINPGWNERGEDTRVSGIPDALVLFNPVFDNGPGGFAHDRVKDYWEEISPLHNIDARTPPTIVFLGTHDKLVPVATAETYRKRMQNAGRRCDLHLFENQPHGFFNYVNRGNYDRTVVLMDEFLASLGFLVVEK